MSFIDELFEDAGKQETAVPSDASLAQIAELAKQQADVEAEIEDLEMKLEQKKKELGNIQNKKLPDLMTSLGLSSFTLVDGRKIDVSTEYYAGITKEKQARAFTWLRANGHGDLIKNQIVVSIPKGKDSIAEDVAVKLKELNVDFQRNESVHASTLKAFVREQIENGKPLDHDALSVYPVQVAKITQPKDAARKRKN